MFVELVSTLKLFNPGGLFSTIKLTTGQKKAKKFQIDLP